MVKKTLDGVPFYEFELFQKFRGGLRHAIFTRHNDISSPSTVQRIFETDAHPIAFKNQLHGIKIVNVIPMNNAISAKAEIYEGDVFITEFSNIPLMIRIADCASILLFDPVKKVIANIHAGWRGLTKRVIHKTVKKLSARYGSQKEDLFACVSPMIGPCCCHFSDPYRELPKAMHCYISEKNMVDLWGAVEGHLRECGVLPEHIENPRMCTVCHPEDFFSYRREGGADRFGTVIMLC